MKHNHHPQTDGQSEVVNRGLEIYLPCFTMDKLSLWSSWLPWAEHHYNTAAHSSIGTSPFHTLYGQSPPTLVCYEWGSAATVEVDNYLNTRDALLAELKDHLHRAQQKKQQYANKKRRAVSPSRWASMFISSSNHISKPP